MGRRRQTPARFVRNLLLEIALLLMFAWFMWTMVRPWATDQAVNNAKQMFIATPRPTPGP